MAVATVPLDPQSVQAPAPVVSAGAKPPTLGLAHWMNRVLAECDEAAKDFAPDPVHDLRVAIRRCRSLGEGMKVIDYAEGWQDMRSAGKVLFRALGELRDVQVMRDWAEELGTPDEPATLALKSYISARESELKKEAMSALHDFDRKQWQAWSKELPRRARRIRPGSVVFQHMALERWTAARNQQRAALRNKTGTALHQLRILIKKFRYTVENFLPERHEAWGDDLKKLQDWLGEVHDLDVLWATAVAQNVFADEEERVRWHKRIDEERQKRVEKYKEKMLGPDSLWAVWRAGLPRGQQVRAAAIERLKTWASFMDPDFEHSERVAELARQLYQGIEDGHRELQGGKQRKPIRKRAGLDAETLLVLAAWLHDVGRFKKEKGHHKVTAGQIRQLEPPLGLSRQDLKMAAFVARYHRGILPQSRHRDYVEVAAEARPEAFYLAGVLRFVDALDAGHSGRVTRIRVQNTDGLVKVYAQGYSAYAPGAEEIAASRFLLERSLRKAIAVKPLVERGGGTRRERRSSAVRNRSDVQSS